MIILHHSGIYGEEPQYGMINEYHKRKKFPKSSTGKYGGYHWLIERNGTRRQYRIETEEGAHTYGYNDHIGICMAGDFRRQAPNHKQLKALKKLCIEICERHDVDQIVEHRDLRPTACPGWDFSGYVLGFLASEGVIISPRYSDSKIKLETLRRRFMRATGVARSAAQRGIRRLLRKG